jgi:TrmH family RNA methyltransferase
LALEILSNIRIVLIHTTHPGNIGAAARAMKTMGLARLRLVTPKYFPHDEATARAAGATDVLDNAQVCATFVEAVADCGLVLGVSARSRTIAWPQWDARSAGRQVILAAQNAPVALVFGSERVGLSNADIDRCHGLVQIPANPEYASLNLAAAVQVLAYELRMAALEVAGVETPAPPEHVPADAQDVERFYEHLRQTLVDVEFLDPENPRQLMRRLRRLFNRALPDTMELNILRGILAAVDVKNSKSR